MDVRELLDQWDIRPSKGLGQNFLVEQTILDKIVSAAELTRDDVVLEIGAGVGNLTERLASVAGHVVAVELDHRLIPVLESTLADFDNVTLVEGDILDLAPEALVSQPMALGLSGYKVVSNLPYYITSAALRHLLEADRKPRQIVLTVQREVAERIVARPGEMSLLAVSVQFYGCPQLLFRVKAGSFYPSPGVDSAVVQVDLYDTLPVPVEDTAAFFRVVKAGFAQRRKQLRNSLAAGLRLSPKDVAVKLQGAGIDSRRRPQTLCLEEWVEVARALDQIS